MNLLQKTQLIIHLMEELAKNVIIFVRSNGREKMTLEVNKPITEAEQLFYNLIWEPALLAGETALFAAVPILGAPVLGTIDREVISLLSGWLWNQFRLTVDVTAIKLLNSEHQAAYDKASINLKVISIDSGENSSEYKQALVLAQLSLAKFTRFNE
jgi:hypothetical protein